MDQIHNPIRYLSLGKVCSHRVLMRIAKALLVACLALGLTEIVYASTLSELHEAWQAEEVESIVSLREMLDEGSGLKSEFQADYMVATAQCGTNNSQRQRAGLALLNGLLEVYPDLDLPEIGTVYVAVRRCRDIMNGELEAIDGSLRKDQWLDPIDVAALIVEDNAKAKDGSDSRLKTGDPSPAVNLVAYNQTGIDAYDASDVCQKPCGPDGQPGSEIGVLFVLKEAGRNGPDSLIVSQLSGLSVNEVQNTSRTIQIQNPALSINPIIRPIVTILAPANPVVEPIGAAVKPIGAVIKPIGAVIRPIGGVVKPIGAVIRPIGGVVKPIGAVIRPIGEVVKPIGGVVRPIGGVVRPIGGIIKPIGEVVKPIGGIINRKFRYLSS